MRSRLAYLHLPKAAGTSLRAALSAYYDEEDTVPWSFDRHLFGDDPRLGEVAEPVFLGQPDELAGYAYMEGHWTLPTITSAFDPSDVVCVLREPRARFLSHYTFWRGWPEWMHDLWQPYDGARFARLTLGEYCQEPAIAHQADNLVTRLILGPHPLAPNDSHIRAGDVDRLAAQACRRLDDVGYVDVLERGDDVYRDLESWFGSPLTRERLNETDLGEGEPVDLDDFSDARTMSLVNDRNASDLQIWHHVAAARGVAERVARSTSDAAFARSVAKIAAGHAALALRPEVERYMRERIAGEIAEKARLDAEAWERSVLAEQARLAELPPVSFPTRLIRLMRRGPAAVWRRTFAEIDRRRGRPHT